MMNKKEQDQRPDKASEDIYDQQVNVFFDYPVCFTDSVFDNNNIILENSLDRLKEDRCHRIAVFIDDGVVRADPAIIGKIERYFESRNNKFKMLNQVQALPGGREIKTSLKIAGEIVNTLGDLGMDRQSFVVAIGGGSFLDAIGFAVSLVHRGLRLVRVPTTTLAQADGAVGVKNGLDIRGSKNFVGTFAPPFAVINDAAFLETLSFENYIGGVAEAFKVAMIKDKAFFDYLCENVEAIRDRDTQVIGIVIRRCARLHLDHIRNSGDPFELGSARPLDFGHWAGHKLEVMSDYTIRHGQAVAVGIAIDSFLAMRMGLINQDQFQRALNAMTGCGLEVWNENICKQNPDGKLIILEGLSEFREHLGGRLTIPLPRGIGTMVEINEIDVAIIEEAVEHLKTNFG